MTFEQQVRAGWKILQLGFNPILVTGLAAAPTLIGNLIIFRSLPVQAAGTYNLVLVFSALVLMLGLLGQNTVILRYYSGQEPGVYRWRRDLLTGSLLSLPVLLLASVAIELFTRTSSVVTGVTAVNALLLVITVQGAAMLSAHGHYSLGSMLPRLSNSAMIIPGIVGLVAPLPLGLVLGVFLGGGLISAILTVLLLLWKVPNGSRTLQLTERRDGLMFMLSSGSGIYVEQGIIGFAQPFVGNAGIAALGAINAPLRVYDLIRTTLYPVLQAEVNRRNHPRYRQVFLLLAGGLLVAGLVTLLGLPPLLDWLYQGRYAASMWLVGPLTAYRLLLILALVPYSHLVGRTGQKTLYTFIWVRTLLLAGIFVVGLWWIQGHDLPGVAQMLVAFGAVVLLVALVFFSRSWLVKELD